jgi:hypothetical protein
LSGKCGDFDHARRDVHRDHAAPLAQRRQQRQSEVAGAAAQVDHGFTAAHAESGEPGGEAPSKRRQVVPPIPPVGDGIEVGASGIVDGTHGETS